MLLLADCWLRQGEDRKVIDLVTPVAEQNRDDLAIAYLLGTALLRDKQIDRGQQMIDRILRNGDSAEAHLLLGTARLNAREYEAAIADFEKAAQLNHHLHDFTSSSAAPTSRPATPRQPVWSSRRSSHRIRTISSRT